MDCTSEEYCELCEIIIENEKQREMQEMKRMQAYDVRRYESEDRTDYSTSTPPGVVEGFSKEELWDTQP